MTLNRWGALFGILAAVFLVVAVLISGETPDGDAADQEWIDYIEDNSSLLLIRAYLFIAAALSLTAFYSFGVRPRLGEANAVDRAVAGFGAGAVALAAASLAAGGLVGAAVAGAHEFGDIAIDPSLTRTLDNFVYGFVLVGGGLSAGVMMVVVAIQTRRNSAFPAWVLWVTLVAILGMAAAIIFIPFVLLPIWLIAVSVALFRASGAPASEAAPMLAAS